MFDGGPYADIVRHYDASGTLQSASSYKALTGVLNQTQNYANGNEAELDIFNGNPSATEIDNFDQSGALTKKELFDGSTGTVEQVDLYTGGANQSERDLYSNGVLTQAEAFDGSTGALTAKGSYTEGSLAEYQTYANGAEIADWLLQDNGQWYDAVGKAYSSVSPANPFHGGTPADVSAFASDLTSQSVSNLQAYGADNGHFQQDGSWVNIAVGW